MEGTFFSVLTLPRPWPPTKEFTLLSSHLNEVTLTLIICCDGHLRLTIISDDKTKFIYYSTQPINIIGSGMIILVIAWKDNEAEIRINGNKLKNCMEAPFEMLEIKLKENEDNLDLIPSFEHPDAIVRCQGWINSRHKLITRPTSNRVPKSINEQVNDLKRSIESLQNFTTAVYAGNINYVKYLAGELRALVVFGKGYNPLLLRIAAFYQLPLPIFAFPKDKSQPEIIKQSSYHYTGGGFSITKTFPGQTLMDLQEWLQTYLIVENYNASSSTNNKKQKTKKTIMEIIADTTNTLGIAHYDESVPIHIDNLRNFKLNEGDLLIKFLVEASGLIVTVGNYVIQKASQTIPIQYP